MDMENFTLSVDGDGIALIVFDVPGRSMNVISQSVQREIGQLAQRIAGDVAIRGAVFSSGKASGFCAGADLVEMEGAIEAWRKAASQDELRAGVESAGSYSQRLRELETCAKPVVAVIAGMALGGGLELALACHHRVAADTAGLRLGFPEATIGLMPGAGATQRLSRLMGIEKALPFLLDGSPIATEVALANGVVHALVPADALVETARRWILDGGPATPPWDEKKFAMPGGGPNSPNGYRTFPFAIARIEGAKGAHYPAQANILRAVYEGSQVPIDAALRIEARYFFNTVRSAQARDMVRTFFTSRQKQGKAPLPSHRDDLVAALKAAWTQEGEAIVADGVSAALVNGIARNLGGWPIESAGDAAGERELHLLAGDTSREIGNRLLRVSSDAAQSFLATVDGADRDIADLIAVDAGFPSWTGGPFAYLATAH